MKAGVATEISEAPTFEQIRVSDRVTLSKTFREEDLRAFAALSGDFNPLHMEEEFAGATHFRRRVVHGMLVASYASTLIGMRLPGPGALWAKQDFRWIAPVFIGDTIVITLVVTHKSEGTRALSISVKAVNQNGKVVMEGDGSVVLLEKKHKLTQDRPITERVALVTGAARGVGAVIAAALADAGAAVAINSLREDEAAQDLCRKIRQTGGRAIAVEADVTNPEAVQQATERTSAEFGQSIDILINNAVLEFAPQPFMNTTWDEMKRQLDVYVRGAFNCCQAVIPGMLAQRSGRIVNIGAVLTRNVPPAQWTAFTVAKAALNALTRSLAAEFGPGGLSVNMVSSGITESEGAGEISERLRKVQAMQTPLRRLATPDDIARFVVFLCGDGGDFITGADIPVCGGAVM